MNLASRIFSISRRCLEHNVTPAEIWLGPNEFAEFEAFVQREIASGRMVKQAELEDANKIEFGGLPIRKMVDPGIRVGATFT